MDRSKHPCTRACLERILEVRALAERWRDLTERTIAGFTGGDPGITESLSRMYKEEGPEKASRGTFDADLLEYVTRAQSAAG